MKAFFISVLTVFFLVSCEQRQRIVEEGEIISAPVVRKYERGSNNPSKGTGKKRYVVLKIEQTGREHKAPVDLQFYKKVQVGDRLYGYLLDGEFILARGELRQ